MKPKNVLNCKLFVTTQNGRVANCWKSSYFNQHPLQAICNMSEDVQCKNVQNELDTSLVGARM